jgi:hypothetical protein
VQPVHLAPGVLVVELTVLASKLVTKIPIASTLAIPPLMLCLRLSKILSL